MTDGQDRVDDNMITQFKKDLDSYVSGISFVIHSVGFGSNHDSNLLLKLTQLGTDVGAYRFADPSDNDDALSYKLNGLLDGLRKGGSGTATSNIILHHPEMKILGSYKGSYWVECPVELPYVEGNVEFIDVSIRDKHIKYNLMLLKNP